MARTVEFLIPPGLSRTGGPMMEALYKASLRSGDQATRTESYVGKSDWLVLYGVGHVDRAPIRNTHVANGRRCILWDLGYFGRKKIEGYLRVSIDVDHPQDWLGFTPRDPSRWNYHQIELREDANPNGPIILVGLGPKTRRYLNLPDWEANKLADLRTRFPGRKIVFRPKPRRPYPKLDCPTDDHSKIEQLLQGASLVVVRHSNVAVDAAIAGVPFECEGGAAMWLLRREFTPKYRKAFLEKLAWWQWNKEEARDAWSFVQRVVDWRERGIKPED